MTRLIATILSLTLGFTAAIVLVSCGSDEEGLLPGDTADQIEQNLDEVQERAAENDCEGAQEAAAAVSDQVAELGSEVKPRLRRALEDGAAQVVAVAAECVPTVETDTETIEPETTETTETTDTEPTTETTETEPTETTETEPTTETTTSEPPTVTTEPPTTTSPPPANGGSGDGSGGVGPGGGASAEGEIR